MGGECIGDITRPPRFKVPIALTAKDYGCDDPDLSALRRYTAEDGGEARRIYQVPRNEANVATRVDLLRRTSIGTAVSGGFMALMSVKSDVAAVNPQYVETRMRVYNPIRDMTADACGGWNFVVALQAGG